MSILFYQRPDYVNKLAGPLDLSNCQKYVERAACSRSSIPDNLSFSNVVEGKTLPPCSLQDFLDYLCYVARDAENLQFYLWLLDYTKRFNALSLSERRLSPEWKVDKPFRSPHNTIGRNLPAERLEKFSVKQVRTISVDKNGSIEPPTRKRPSDLVLSGKEAYPTPPQTPTSPLWDEFSIQPFRDEVTRITSHYITPSSVRELNLSDRDRSFVLDALKYTTHPSAFAPILSMVFLTLKNQSHPNFIRWSICNGNRPRVIFLRYFAAFWLITGLILAVVLALSHVSRYWRIFCAIPWWIGMTNAIAAYKGLCVLLFRTSVREIHPWEIEGNSATSLENALTPFDLQPTTQTYTQYPTRTTIATRSRGLHPQRSYHSLQSFDLDTTNSSSISSRLSPLGPQNDFEHEAWFIRWAKQPSWRKLMLKTVRVQEEGLKLMQNRIVMQAELWALIVTMPVVVGLVAIPNVKLF